jgi:hypothetical protein
MLLQVTDYAEGKFLSFSSQTVNFTIFKINFEN